MNEQEMLEVERNLRWSIIFLKATLVIMLSSIAIQLLYMGAA